MTQCCSSAPGHQKNIRAPQISLQQPRQMRAQCAVGRKDAFSDWFALWSSSPEWFGRWTADGEIWRLGWSTKEPWQPWWFSPVFYERFRDLGRKHGDQMGSSWENSWEVMGCFGTNTMKYECV